MHESSCEVAGFLEIIGLLFQFLLNHAAACLIESKQFDLFADVDLLGAEVASQNLGHLVNLTRRRGLGLPLAHGSGATVGHEVSGGV